MLKPIVAICFFLAPALASRAELPELFLKKPFSARSLAEAVNHYVDLGPKPAFEELMSIATFYDIQKTDDLEIDKALHGKEIDLAERVGWVSRVLFQAKPKKALSPPGYGELMLPWLTMPLKSWPLFPVAHSGRSYFVLGEGYSLAGVAESPRNYLKYCRKNGLFRKTHLPLPTREEANADAKAPRDLPEWKAIKWTDSKRESGGGGVDYTFPEKNTRAYIQQQCDLIVTERKGGN